MLLYIRILNLFCLQKVSCLFTKSHLPMASCSLLHITQDIIKCTKAWNITNAISNESVSLGSSDLSSCTAKNIVTMPVIWAPFPTNQCIQLNNGRLKWKLSHIWDIFGQLKGSTFLLENFKCHFESVIFHFYFRTTCFVLMPQWNDIQKPWWKK